MKVTIFDDEFYRNFFPITLTRSTGDLRVGILKLRQRLQSFFHTEETNVIIPEFLEEIYRERHPKWQINELSDDKETIFVNSRLRINSELAEKIEELTENTCLIKNEIIIAGKMRSKEGKISSENISEIFANCKKESVDNAELWNYTWEFIAENSNYIEEDFRNFFYEKDNFFETETGVTVLNPYDIWIGDGAEMKPNVVLDASEGPIVIDENAVIMANAVIIGPVYIGKKSRIKVGAKIYEGTSVGPVCKVGGEVEETIFQAYSNKQHDGFLGHSYIGEWVNLGADTNNSDLKNNYKTVKSYFYPSRKKIDTGNTFVGTVIGDHSKTGINSTINTGTVIGVGCNLFGRELIKDFIPSFSWGEGENLSEYRLDKFLETAQIVKKRRNLELTAAEKELYSKIKEKEFA